MYTWVHSVKGVHQQQSSVERIKSSFDQRLEAQRAEERRRIQLRQGALQLQREREQRMKEERQQHSDKREQRSASRSARLKGGDVHILTCHMVSGRGQATRIATLFPKRVIALTTKVRHRQSVQFYFKYTRLSLSTETPAGF